ncbi:MAG: chemotaxis protein CheA [Phycisphaerales bacterium]
MHEFDAELLQDFITESSELLDQFDGDLVLLESTPTDPELLNRVFRALHTIKGSASFLSLTELVRVAHAAEEALNNARRGGLLVTREVMDLLLEAADAIKGHLAQLQNGDSALTPARGALVDQLTKMGQSTGGAAAAPAHQSQADHAPASEDHYGPRAALDLPPHKADLLEFMAADFEESVGRMAEAAALLRDAATRADACADLAGCCEPTAASVEFFELPALLHIVQAIEMAADRIAALDESRVAQLAPRIGAMVAILRENAEALKVGAWIDAPCETLLDRVTDLSLGNPIDEAATLPEDASASDALRVDCGIEPASAPFIAGTEAPTETLSAQPAPAADRAEPGDKPAANSAAGSATIRVDVERLEALLDLVGELVLQKNRVTALTRRVGVIEDVPRDTRDALSQGASDLDRICGDLQLAVMRTRMQPLDKLFGRYPRLIRDLARATNKKLRLVIEGGDTEVDKSVIEQLGDPLVHILRNSSDHGVETPDARKAAGKDETGTITLRARHEGEHVLVEICDDGRGLDREKILKRAVERGLCTADEGAAMTDSQVFQFIFAPGFSTAEQVTDLSGRGVGMDVVRTNIEKVKGAISLRSALGQGTTVSIAIPLTVAILDAMVIGVGQEEYAIPLGNIVEIVKPNEKDISTIHGRPVMRLRDEVLPLIDACEVFRVPEARREPSPFAVVLSMNGASAGLMVTRLIGQREIVVKSLESTVASGAPVSGATVGDEGEASLIIDVARLLDLARTESRAGRSRNEPERPTPRGRGRTPMRAAA